jgi:two-component system, response regulator RegA
MTSEIESQVLDRCMGQERESRQVVVVAEPDMVLRQRLSDELRDRGYFVAGCEATHQLAGMVAAIDPDILIGELRLADGPSLDIIASIQSANPALRIVILTGHSSVATAVRCAKLGIEGYLSKPAAVERILDASTTSRKRLAASPAYPMTLDRAIWEYINRIVQESGSISNAAPALRIDRRTLRRMLGKHVPLRAGDEGG